MVAKGLRLPIALLLLVAATVSAQQLPGYAPTLMPGNGRFDAGATGRMAEVSKLPMSFEANQGQTNAKARFVSRGPGYSLMLTDNSAVLVLTRNSGSSEAPALSSSQVTIDLAGGVSKPAIEALDLLPGKANYLIGNDRKRWRTNIPTYRKVRYRGVYPGVDLIYYGNQRQLEYDFVVAPGRDPKAIALRLRGADKLELSKDGELVVRTGGGELRFHRPYVYQEGSKGIETVAGNYVLRADNTVAFRIGEYDHRRALVIDPTLSYATYFGGTSFDVAYAIAVDAQITTNQEFTSAHVAGYTCSSGLVTTVGTVQDTPAAGSCDAFVLKLQPELNGLVWATYLGGSGIDVAYGIAVTPGSDSPNVYVTGYTSSTNFPAVNSGFTTLNGAQDAFVAKLAPDGSSLVYSGYWGGSGSDVGRAIAVDAAGNAVIAGDTTSLDFPKLSNAYPDIHGGVYISNDSGNLWTLSNTNPTIASPYIRSLAVAPQQAMPSIVYAGTNNAGVWWRNGTTGAWTKSAGIPAGNSVLALAIDPQNSSIIYAGTSVGVYRTTDSGATWTALNTGLTGSWYVQALAFDSSGASHDLFAGTSSGMYVLPSGTTTWQPITLPPTSGGGQPDISSIAIAWPYIFAGSTGSPGLYESSNGGQAGSWGAVPGGAGPIQGIQALAIAYGGSNPLLYAAGYNNNFLVCTIPGTPSCTQSNYLLGVDHVMAIAVDNTPAGAETVYVAGTNGIAKNTLPGLQSPTPAPWTPLMSGLSNQDVWAIALDPNGVQNVYAGTPFQEGFAAKFSDTGAPVYSTPIGGDRETYARGVAVDANDNVYVTGYSNASNFPVYQSPTTPGQGAYKGGNDIFLLKLASGTPVYSLLMGGSADDFGFSVAVDNPAPPATPNVYLTGNTCSTGDFPTYPVVSGGPTSCSAFVSKLNPGASSLNLAFSTLLGGTDGSTIGNGIAVDNTSGNVWVTGETWATEQSATNLSGFPTTNASQPFFIGTWFSCSTGSCPYTDAFVTQYNSAGTLQFSTYLGGENNDYGNAIAVDPFGRAYVAGYSFSQQFPVTPVAIQSSLAGAPDMFVARFTSGTHTDDIRIDSFTNDQPSGVSSGTPINYTVSVSNAPGGDVSGGNNVVLMISPVGVNIKDTISNPTDQLRCKMVSLQSIRCELGTLAPGASTTVSFTETPQEQGTLAVRAWVTSDDTDLNDSNNRANLSTPVSASYLVDVQMSHLPQGDLVGGSLVTETITVTNELDPLQGGTLNFYVPNGSTLKSYPGCVTVGNGQVDCNLPSPMSSQDPPAVYTIEYYAPVVGGTYSTPPSLTISTVPNATLTPTSTVTDTLVVLAGTDIALSACPTLDAPLACGGPSSSSTMSQGGNLVFKALVTNNGPNAANVVITGTTSLPSNWPITATMSDSTPCPVGGPNNDVITCTISNLGVGASLAITATATAPLAGYLTLHAAVSSSSLPDPDLANNSTDVRLEVKPTPNSNEAMILSDGTSASYRFFNPNGGEWILSPPIPHYSASGVVLVSDNARLLMSGRSVTDVTLALEVSRMKLKNSAWAFAVADGGKHAVVTEGTDTIEILDLSTFDVVNTISLNGTQGDDPAKPADLQLAGVAVRGNIAYINPQGTTAAGAGFPVITVDLSTCWTATGCTPVVGTVAGSNVGRGSLRSVFRRGHYILAPRMTTTTLPTGGTTTSGTLLLIDTNNADAVTPMSLPYNPNGMTLTRDSADPLGRYAFLVGGPHIMMLDLTGGSATFGTVIRQIILNFSASRVDITADGTKLAVVNSSPYAAPGNNAGVLSVSQLLSGASIRPATLSDWVVPPFHVNGTNGNPEAVLRGVAVGYVDLTPAGNAPVLDNIAVSSVSNDVAATVTITGSNFSPDARVRLGWMDPVAPDSVSPDGTTITLSLPAGSPAQKAPWIVTNSNSGSVSVFDRVVSTACTTNCPGPYNFAMQSPLDYQPAYQVVYENYDSGSISVAGRGPFSFPAYDADATSMPAGTAEVGLPEALSLDGSRLYMQGDAYNLRSLNLNTGVADNPAPSLTLGSSYFYGLAAGPDPVTLAHRLYIPSSNVTGTNFVDYASVLQLAAVDTDPASLTFNQQVALPGGLQTISSASMAGETYSDLATITPDGKYVYALYENYVYPDTTGLNPTRTSYLVVFDVVGGSVRQVPVSTLGAYVGGLISTDGHYLYLAGADAGGLWDGSIVKLDISADPTLASASPVRITGTAPGGSGLTAPRLGAFTGNVSNLFAVDPYQNLVLAFDSSNNSQIGSYIIPGRRGMATSYGAMAVSPDGQQLYVSDYNNNLIYVLSPALLAANAANPVITSMSSGIGPDQLWVKQQPEQADSFDLAVTMTGPGSAAPGELLTYSITVTSTQDVVASLVDALPKDPIDPSIKLYYSNQGCVYSATAQLGCGSAAYDDVSKALNVSDLAIPAGGRLEWTVQMYAPGSVGLITNTARVSSARNEAVLPNNTASVSTSVTAGLSITTPSPLPNGTSTLAYSPLQFAASGGTTPYTWSLPPTTGNVLPPGLTLTSGGLLSGTPTQAGTFTFTVQATDSDPISPQTASAPMTLTVSPPVAVSVTPSFATLASGGSQQFLASVANATDQSVTWAVNGIVGGNSIVGTISSGTYFAPAFPVTATVTATSVADPTKMAAAAVRVIPQVQPILAAWGYNADGQLGNGTTTDSHTPVQVQNLSGVSAVAAGHYHNLALKGDGTVWAWGGNAGGQLGNGTTTPSSTPVQVSGLSGVVAVAAGEYNSLALKSDGTVWAWGGNAWGQLGNGTTTNSSTPVQVSGLSGVIAIAFGGGHSMALKGDGTVWAWGGNSNGELGDGTTTNSSTPLQVIGLPGVVAIAAGGSHSMALKGDGTVWAWGWNGAGELGNGTYSNSYTPVQVSNLTGVVAIAGGGAHSTALASNGTVWTWGDNSYGQLGNPSIISNSNIPVQVSSLSGAAAIAAGWNHSAALTSDGTARTWGSNYYGQLGNGTTADSNIPVQVIGLTGAVAIAAGTDESLALTTAPIVAVTVSISPSFATLSTSGTQQFTATVSNNTAVTWAVNGIAATTGVPGGNGIVGTITDTGLYTAPAFPVTATVTATSAADPAKSGVAVVSVTSQALTVATAWGMNTNGGLGNNTTIESHAPVQVSNLTGVTRLAGGYGLSMALLNDGSMWSWGYNYYGQLGNDYSGPGSDFYTPQQVGNFSAGAGVVAVASGGYHGLALTNDGYVSSWGYNLYGQLGDGTNYDTAWPTSVLNLSGVVGIAAGQYHSLALLNDGTVWAWGYNGSGQLGDGVNTDSNTPVQVSNLSGVVAVSASENQSLALKSDGTVWGWGMNTNGQLGNGANSNTNLPVQVTGPGGVGVLTGVVAIVAGGFHSMALKNDGTVWAWGANGYGQLGTGDFVYTNTPVQVSGLSNITAIAAGWDHSVALKSNGTVSVWGYNQYGQVGDGTSGTNRSLPVQVSTLSGVVAIGAGAHHTLAATTVPFVMPLDHFDVTASTLTPGSGAAFNVTVTAKDVSNNVITGYTGAIQFSLSSYDPGAVLPPEYTFVTADGGSHTFVLTLAAQVPQTISVYDSFSWSKTGAVNVTVLAGPACATAPSGVVSWWRAEGNANDFYAANNGTLMNGATFATGMIGQAFNFGGANQYVSLPDNVILSNPAWTVAAWFKTYASGVIVGMQNGPYGGSPVSYWDPLLFVGGDGKFSAGVWGAARSSPQAVNDGTWHYAAVSYASGVITASLDGVPLGSASGATMQTMPVTQIGTGYTVFWPTGNNGWYDFNGEIDEVALFNRALSTTEIQTVFASGYAGICAVVAQADLALDAATAPVVSGNTVTYAVKVTNLSSTVDATHVLVTDTLNRYTFVSGSGPAGACSESAGVVSCPTFSLPRLQSATVTVGVTAPISGWASNLFHASADQLDPNPANNSVQIGPVVEGANTAVGTNVAAFASDSATGASVAVTFSSVTQAGNTTLSATSSGPAPPVNYRAGTPLVFYDLHTTALWTGSAVVNLNYAGVTFHHPDRLRLFHQENGVWVDRTLAVDAVRSIVTAAVPSFSLFALFEPVNHVPVAAAKTALAPGVSAAGASLKLDATASSDVDGDALTYRWSGPFPEGGGSVTGATPTVTLPLGVSSVTLVVNDGEADSAPLAVPVTVSDFSITLPAVPASAARGQAITLTVSITPKYGSFDGPITLACPNLPAGSSCAFSSATVTPGSQSATATLTLTIGSAIASARPAPRGSLYALWLGMLPFGLLLSGGVRRKRAWLLLLAVVLLLVATQFGCGGGSNTPPPAQTTTPTSTMTVIVSGTSGSLTHTTTATIAVN